MKGKDGYVYLVLVNLDLENEVSIVFNFSNVNFSKLIGELLIYDVIIVKNIFK